MKQKLFSTIGMLLYMLMSSTLVWAQDYTDYLTSANGFTEVTDLAGLQSGSNYYYVFQSAEDPTLVLRTGKWKAKPDWASDGSWSMWYANAASSPVTDLHSYYLLEYNATYGIGVKSAVNSNNCFQTHSGSAYMWVNTFHETAPSEWSGLLPTYNTSAGYWILREYQFRENNESYLGPWDPAIGAVNDIAVAGNRTNATGDEAGHFKIWRISKTDFATLKSAYNDRALYSASSSHPVNATYRITNPSFETGDLTGWTTNGTAGNDQIKTVGVTSNGDGQYALNMFQWWSTSMTASQEVSLPSGIYDVSAVMAAWDIDEATLSAGSKSVSVTGQGDGTGIPLEISDIIVNNNTLTITASSNADWWSDGRSPDTNWQYACGFFKLDNVQLTCKGVYFSYNAIVLPNDNSTTLVPGQWYYYDAPTLGQYSLNGTLTDMVYTQNGQQIINSLETRQARPVLTLNAGRIYFMTTCSGVTLNITSGGAEGTSVTFTAASLNVDGLPSYPALGINEEGRGDEGAYQIGQYIMLKRYDIISIQEDFNYHKKLIEPLGNTYGIGTHRGSVGLTSLLSRADTDGLEFFWNKDNGRDAANETITQYTSTASTDGNQYVKKGFRYYEVTIADGMKIDVYITHMDAGDNDDAKASKNAQLIQLADAINANSHTNRPKLVLGDTNCRYTREKVKENFIDRIEAQGLFTVKDVWVEKVKNGIYPTYGGASLNDEVVDKIFYLNPTAENTMQLTPGSYTRESDYTVNTVANNGDYTALGDHAPLVVPFTAVQPAVQYADANDRWLWTGEVLQRGTMKWRLYNAHYGTIDPAKQGFLTSDATLSADPNNSKVHPFTFWGDANNAVSISSDYNKLRLWSSLGSYKAGLIPASESGATTFNCFDTNNDSESNTEYASTTNLAYHFKASNHFFGMNGVSEPGAHANTSALNAWALISPEQVQVYNRYNAAWEKALTYVTYLPLEDETKDALNALLQTTGVRWTDNVTTQLETLNADIERWFDDDLTAMIVNPSFELRAANTPQTTSTTYTNYDVFGWTVATDAGEAFIANKADHGDDWSRNMDNMDGNYLFNTWGGTPANGYFVRQTISGLAEGFYKLRAVASSTAGNSVSLVIGSTTHTTPLTGTRPESQTLEVPLHYHNGEGDLVIGAQSNTWFQIDNFKLLRYDYYYDETITDAEYATTAIRYNTEVPTGVEVYYATAINPANGDTGGKVRDHIHLEKHNGKIAAGEGVILYKAGNNASRQFRFYRTDESVERINGNMLTGTIDYIPANQKRSDGTYYMLGKKTITYDKRIETVDDQTGEVTYSTVETTEPVVGFYEVMETAGIKAHKAYLFVSNNPGKGYLFSFDDDDTTPITVGQAAHDGKIAAIYSLGGARQNELKRGLNIVRMSDGGVKKIMVK